MLCVFIYKGWVFVLDGVGFCPVGFCPMGFCPTLNYVERGVDCDFSHCSRCNDWIRTKIMRELCKKAWLSLTMKHISISQRGTDTPPNKTHLGQKPNGQNPLGQNPNTLNIIVDKTPMFFKDMLFICMNDKLMILIYHIMNIPLLFLYN